MQPQPELKPAPFVDRRQSRDDATSTGAERRQFKNSYNDSRPEVAELAEAVDQYKMTHRRRFITFEELYDVMAGLGYHK